MEPNGYLFFGQVGKQEFLTEELVKVFVCLQSARILFHGARLMEPLAWNAQPVHMMDFEGSSSSGVVEYGIVTLAQGCIAQTETALCAPIGEMTAIDQRVHGIQAAQVSGKQRFSTNYDKFIQLRKSGIFAAHNRHAENNFLKTAWALPTAVPDWRTGEGTAQEWGPWIDTLAIYKGIYPDLDSYALGHLVDRFQLREQLDGLAGEHCPPDRSRAHCALFDALASALLLVRLDTEPSLRPYLSLQWLLQFSNGVSPQRELF